MKFVHYYIKVQLVKYYVRGVNIFNINMIITTYFFKNNKKIFILSSLCTYHYDICHTSYDMIRDVYFLRSYDILNILFVVYAYSL